MESFSLKLLNVPGLESRIAGISKLFQEIQTLRESAADPGYGSGKGGGGSVGGAAGVSPVGKGPPKQPAKVGRPPAPKK